MNLILKIIAPTHLMKDQIDEYTFDELGGTIGRGADNDFVLFDPERYISTQHGLIEFRHGQFYITDTSTNGVIINDAFDVIGNGKSSEIFHGDKITIGAFQLLAQVSAIEANKPADTPWPLDNPVEVRKEPPLFANSLDGLVDDYSVNDYSKAAIPASISSVDPLDLLDGINMPGVNANTPDPLSLLQEASKNASSNATSPGLDDLFGETAAADERISSALAADILADVSGGNLEHSIENQPLPINIDEQFKPSDNLIPENWDILEPNVGEDIFLSPGSPPQTPSPVQINPKNSPNENPVFTPGTSDEMGTANKVASTTHESELVAAFLSGCGIEHCALSYADQIELMTKIGQITRTSINGLMQVLQARASLKSGFRVNRTTIAPVENNPLKFSVTTDEALNILLSDDKTGYMSAIDAVAEGYQDMQAHQLAMMAGMQATINAIFTQFEPGQLQRTFNNQSGSSFIPGHKKSKNWENYVDFYHRIAERLQDDFQNVYGEQFAKAYEEQVLKLMK